MIKNNCQKNRISIPILPCAECTCPWYVKNVEFCNCFWMIADCITEFQVGEFSEEEIAEILDMPIEEVQQIIEEATKKIRISLRKQLITIE